jgi:NDP-sugar pyrophosphorylase family protein
MSDLRRLSKNEIDTLINQGCTAENWGLLRVASDFDPGRIVFTKFFGQVQIESNNGMIEIDEIKKPCGLYNASIANCHIGRNVFISNIGSSLQNYIIEEGVIIEDVSVLVTTKNSRFGEGVRINVLNETGGRSVTLFKDMNAQTSYMQAIYKNNESFQKKLENLIQNYLQHVSSEKGKISEHARVRSCGVIQNVNIGPHTSILGASEMKNGTILSCVEDPTTIGSNVIARDFIISEGAVVDGGAVLENIFVGQGCQIGKLLTAENSLFFANSEGFQTEACSLFAGPYSVTHHKSTLLIACMLSFFNGGSGTNQSNHMYKLGPVHQGVMERGCKTGSFGYILLESLIPAFSVVIGKHMSNIDIPDFPFSFLTEENGKSNLMPAINLFSMGTARDEEKWPLRDRRKAPLKRDSIIFDVFSPYTVEKMRRGRAILNELYEKTPREVKTVHFGGVQIRRLLLKKGAKYYKLAIDRYLIGRIMSKMENLFSSSYSMSDLLNQLQKNNHKAGVTYWTDVGGLLVMMKRIDSLIKDVVEDRISTMEELLARIKKIHDIYIDDEWDYICTAAEEEYGISPSDLNRESLIELTKKWENAAASLNSLVLENTKSEFSEISMISYGLDLDTKNRYKDFKAVRGSYDTNSIVSKLAEKKDQIRNRVQIFAESLKKLS